MAQAKSQRCLSRLSDNEIDEFFRRITETKSRPKLLQNCEIVEGDIRKLSSAQVKTKLQKPLFCIAGGPPCQPFSKAGKQESLDCKKNGTLFFEFVRLVRDLSPEWFIFENVKGLTFTKTDVLYTICSDCSAKELANFKARQDYNKTASPNCQRCKSSNTKWLLSREAGGSLKIILNEFRKSGYHCHSKTLNSADFGVPQYRERLFIVGSRDNHPFAWPSPTHRRPQAASSQQLLFEEQHASLPDHVTMREALWPHKHPHSGPIKDQSRLWVKNVVRPHDEPVTWTLNRPSPTIGAHQSAKLAFAPHGIPEAQKKRQQWATRGQKQGDTPPVAVEHQYLTDEELLVLQSFPRWWYLHGTRMQRAFQIGNAVPPLLAQKIGESVLNASRKFNASNPSNFASFCT